MIEVIVFLGYILLGINLILFLSGFSKNGKAFKIFTLYTLIIFFIQISTYILTYLGKHNLFLSHFYFILQFLFLSVFYISLMRTEFQRKIIIGGLFSVLLVLAIQYASDLSLFHKFNLFEIFITSFMIIIYATIHFYNMLNEKKEFYFINMGILIYLFGSTVLFLAGNLVANLTSRYNTVTWTLNAFLYVIYQSFILVEWKKSFDLKKINIHKNEPHT